MASSRDAGDDGADQVFDRPRYRFFNFISFKFSYFMVCLSSTD